MTKNSAYSIIALILLISSCSLFGKNQEKRQEINYQMKEYPTGDAYSDLWKKVEKFENDGLPKSALKVVEQIFDLANKDKNVTQLVKSSMYKIKYSHVLEEESYVSAVANLDSLTNVVESPQKQMLHSILAEMYWSYYSNNRWKFSERTQTVNFVKEDIRTWSLEDIVEQTSKHYGASLSQSSQLQEYSLLSFKELLVNGQNTDTLRPTLYDFLAHRALNYFKNTEPDITKPAYYFKLESENLYNSSSSFSSMKLNSKDTASTKLKALKIYQELIRLHLTKTHNKSALADLELDRLGFIHSHNTISNNDELYRSSLERLSQDYEDIEYYSTIRWKLAKFYKQLAGNYRSALKKDQQNETYKVYRKKAHEIATEAKNKFPNSYGGLNCENLINSIERKALDFVVEEAAIPSEISKGRLSFTNVKKVYLKVVKLDFNSFRNKTFKSTKERVKFFNSQTVVTTWELDLPDDGLFNSHYTEFTVPSLSEGFYAVIAGTTSDFSINEEAIAIAPFWSTNISYVVRNGMSGYEITLLNRKSGIPIEQVKAEVYTREYNYKSRKYRTKKVATLHSDEEGYIKLPRAKNYRQLTIDFSKGEDRYTSLNTHYQYRYYGKEKPKVQQKGFVYTDRAIYRPNQTVYFKGLLFSQVNNQAQVSAGKSTTLIFYDANRKEIERKEVQTNEYGTVSGKFTTPQGLLNGQMRIDMLVGNGRVSSKYFRVEEYKRPKFEVSILPIKGEYKLGDNIKVEGRAKAFAGNNIDGAKVQYRITRKARFPWWCWYYYGYQPQSGEVEITNGTTVTDENGKFTVDFTAIPDESVNKKYSPTYSYVIAADVTDLNGETRSTTQFISVGYNALSLDIDIPRELNTNRKGEFTLSATNLSGEKINTKGTVRVYRIKDNPRLEIKSKWGNPDVFLMNKSEHDKLFPDRNYGNKSEYELQEEGLNLVESYSFDTKKSQELKVKNLKRWKPGKYKIEMKATDKYGNEVTEIKLITVYNDQARSIPVNEYYWAKGEKLRAEPGEKAVFLLGSRAKDIKVLYEIEHQGEIISKNWITLENEQKRIEFPIEEKHRGNVTAHFIFVKENHVYQSNYTVVVPFTNKALDITFETFRNKLLPGQKEQWKVNIKGKKGDKVMAEMLATMYDASLDEFVPHNLGLSVYRSYYSQKAYNYNNGFGLANAFLIQKRWNKDYVEVPNKIYYTLNNFGMYNYYWHGSYKRFRGNEMLYNMDMAESVTEDSEEETERSAAPKHKKLSGVTISKNESKSDKTTANGIPANYGDANGGIVEIKEKDLSQVKARKNFNETAFFFPHLTTNKEGDISFEFEMPEALTKWKFMGLTHTKDMRFGGIQKEIITQKDLMVIPNMPRFLREGDKITLSSKISNVSDKNLNGTAQLFLFDALTNKPISGKFMEQDEQFFEEEKTNNSTSLELAVNENLPSKRFKAKAGQSTSVSWEIEVPFGVSAITYKVVAQAGNFTDGEENGLPILTNRMLVTESMPLPIKKAGTKVFDFNKLKNSGSSRTLKHHKVTLEYTSNPAWYVVQAMPYMMEYPYDCAEQTFTRFYANSLATHIMNGNPKIKQIVEAWKNESPEEFLSNLEKNQELKAVILQQTPWVLEAEDESERKKRIAQLFDLNKMSGELSRALNKLQKMQVASGGWPWFTGMKESRYITQHIATGMGHLDNLGVKNVREDQATWNMVKSAIQFLDRELEEDLKRLKRYNKNYKEEQHLSHIQIQYLYSRSFFKELPIKSSTREAYEYYLAQSQKYWLSYNNYSQGMIALANYRLDKTAEVSKKITASLKENSITHPELGMYWKGMMDGGYYWYQAPIETQALMIELFDVVTNDQETVNELKTWLLKQKQTTDWKTTKATAEACYALLLNGTDLLANEDKVKVKVGDINIAYSGVESSTTRVVKADAGTGYFKTSWSGNEIKPSMGTISVTKKEDGVAWGALYWQYFEQLDKITPHDTPLKIKKKLFIERNTEKGKVLDPISENNVLEIGDKIIVRIEIEVDRNMEYIHMKDMRASGFEPINVLSHYKWQDGLGYYESTKDASTDFFMDYLPRGTFVFEYPLRASQKGNFSNGITSIQCMYAPEFGSHSEGIRVEVR